MVFEHPLLVIAKVAVLLMGGSVAALAFLSWRRTGQRYMLYIALAFCLVAFGSFAEGVAFEFLAWDLFASSALGTAFVLGGLVLLAVLLRSQKVSA